MKMRLDFVSNSSSSSFMLVGAAFTNDELKNAWLKLHPEDEVRLNPDDDLTYDIPDLIANELGLEWRTGISDYYDQEVIGLPFDEMHDDETKRQFIGRISKALSKAFSSFSVQAIVDGGMDN